MKLGRTTCKIVIRNNDAKRKPYLNIEQLYKVDKTKEYQQLEKELEVA